MLLSIWCSRGMLLFGYTVKKSLLFAVHRYVLSVFSSFLRVSSEVSARLLLFPRPRHSTRKHHLRIELQRALVLRQSLVGLVDRQEEHVVGRCDRRGHQQYVSGPGHPPTPTAFQVDCQAAGPRRRDPEGPATRARSPGTNRRSWPAPPPASPSGASHPAPAARLHPLPSGGPVQLQVGDCAYRRVQETSAGLLRPRGRSPRPSQCRSSQATRQQQRHLFGSAP